jgi:hypothetical protein
MCLIRTARRTSNRARCPPRVPPAARCGPSRRKGGSPARRTQLRPTAQSRYPDREAMIALPYLPHARSIHQPATSRAPTAASGQDGSQRPRGIAGGAIA